MAKAYLKPYNAATRWAASLHASPASFGELEKQEVGYLWGRFSLCKQPLCLLLG